MSIATNLVGSLICIQGIDFTQNWHTGDIYGRVAALCLKEGDMHATLANGRTYNLSKCKWKQYAISNGSWRGYAVN